MENYYRTCTQGVRYKEYVWGSVLADVLKRNDIRPSDIVHGLGMDDGRVYKVLKQRLVSFDLADRILSHFGLSYMLSTGEVEVFTKKDLGLCAA